MAAGRGEKISNNNEGAKQGLTAPEKLPVSQTRKATAGESESQVWVSFFFAAHKNVWIRGLGPLSVKAETQYGGWHKKENKINKEVRLIFPLFPIPPIWTASITHLVLCKPADSCMDVCMDGIIENTSLLVSSEADCKFMPYSIHSTLDQSRIMLNVGFWHNFYFFGHHFQSF